MMTLFITSLFLNVASSQGRTNLFKKEITTPPKEIAAVQEVKPTQVKVKKVTQSLGMGNLPADYTVTKAISIEESPIVVPSNKAGIRFKDLKAGDLVRATITESLFAFQDSKSPVRAQIISGPLAGSILIGEANLERNSKRILIEFKRYRDPQKKEVYLTQASAMDQKGILGLEGKIISNEGKYFSAEVIAAGAAGYADSTISRAQTLLGTTQDAPTADTFAKKAIVSALSKTADRFSEKLKQAPEYAVLTGPIEIQILILDQPTQTN